MGQPWRKTVPVEANHKFVECDSSAFFGPWSKCLLSALFLRVQVSWQWHLVRAGQVWADNYSVAADKWGARTSPCPPAIGACVSLKTAPNPSLCCWNMPARSLVSTGIQHVGGLGSFPLTAYKLWAGRNCGSQEGKVGHVSARARFQDEKNKRHNLEGEKYRAIMSLTKCSPTLLEEV